MLPAWAVILRDYIMIVGAIILVYWIFFKSGPNLPPIINSAANLNSSAIAALKA